MSHVHSTQRPAPPVSPGARGFTLYLAVWMSLAVVSLAYIGVAMIRPDLLSDGRSGPSASAADPSTSAMGTLERGLADVRGQLTDLQLKVIRGELREQELAARVGSLEGRVQEAFATGRPAGGPGLAGQPVPGPQAAATVPDRSEPVAAVPKAERGARTPPPARTAAVAAPKAAEVDSSEAETAQRAQPKPKGAPLETASVGRTVPPFGAPEVNVEKSGAPAVAKAEKGDEGPIGVQLGGAPSLDSLRLNWTILSDRHADALGNLQARFVASDALGATSFNLIAGPVPSRTDAIRICAKLRTEGITCRLTSFQGSALQ